MISGRLASGRRVCWAVIAVGACSSWALTAPPDAVAGVIAFSSDRCSEGASAPCGTRLWAVPDEGGAVTQLTPFASERPEDASSDDQPSWSPDGRLVYRRIFDSRAERRSLWIASPDGSSMSQLGPEAPNDRFSSVDEPEWSPDGRWIAFLGRPTSNRRPGGSSAIWLISADGAVLRQLTDGSGIDSNPSFSPDGRRIAFTRSLAESGGSDAELLSMDLDGSNLAPVAVGTPPRRSRLPGSDSLRVTWSPDGQQIALARGQEIYTVRSDGTALQYRGLTTSLFSQIEWSSEPAPGLIISRPFEPQPLYRLDLAGPTAAPRPITPPPMYPSSGGPPVVPNGDTDPDWRASAPILRPPDLDPPLAVPLAAGLAGVSVRGAQRSRVLVVTKRRLRFLALDPSGVRGVSAAVARRHPAKRGRCRLLGRNGFGRPRPCAGSRWHPLRAPSDLARLVRRVRPGRGYLLRLRARDGLGNGRRRPVAVRLVLRR